MAQQKYIKYELKKVEELMDGLDKLAADGDND